MTPNPTDQQLADLHQAYRAYMNSKPWVPLQNNHAFRIDNPVDDAPVYCFTMGATGHEFGLAAYVGPTAKQDLINICTGQNFLASASRVIAGIANKRSDIPPRDLERLQGLGISYSNPAEWPAWTAIPSKANFESTMFLPLTLNEPEDITNEDATILTMAFNAAVAIANAVKGSRLHLDSQPHHPHHRLTLITSRQNKDQSWTHQKSEIFP